MFCLVSGATAAGKSTVAKFVGLRVGHLVCHDYDERQPTDEYTRCQQLEQWVQLALNCQQDCSDPVRIQRMRNRGIDPRWPPTQDVINWAAWQRMHAWDPQWEQRVIVGNGPAEHSYECWIHWKQNDARWKVYVIDTTNVDIDQVLDLVSQWVNSEREKIPLLTKETRWWE
jgi:hypothetical protein